MVINIKSKLKYILYKIKDNQINYEFYKKKTQNIFLTFSNIFSRYCYKKKKKKEKKIKLETITTRVWS